MYQLDDYFGLNYHRVLASVSQATIQDQSAKWKSSFWEDDVVDAAILRAPVVLIFFLYLWAANIFILDKCNLQYHGVLGIKSGVYDDLQQTLEFTLYHRAVITFYSQCNLADSAICSDSYSIERIIRVQH
jgi:hypothetical protein